MNLVGRASSSSWLDSDEIRFVFCIRYGGCRLLSFHVAMNVDACYGKSS